MFADTNADAVAVLLCSVTSRTCQRNKCCKPWRWTSSGTRWRRTVGKTRAGRGREGEAAAKEAQVGDVAVAVAVVVVDVDVVVGVDVVGVAAVAPSPARSARCWLNPIMFSLVQCASRARGTACSSRAHHGHHAAMARPSRSLAL